MRTLLLSVFLLVANFFVAQINDNFIKHLQSNKLNNEHYYYLNQLKSQGVQEDSLNYYYSKLFLQQEIDTLFFKHYHFSSPIFNKDINALRYADYYFLRSLNSEHQKKWFAQTNTVQSDTLHLNIVNLYNSLNSREKTSLQLSNQLNRDIKKYNRLKHRSPAIAAILSTIVPGLGKLYGQRPRSAINTLVINGINAYQSVESIKMYGFKNGFSIFTLTSFSFFYLSNIYGSYHDLKSLKKQKQKQILIDAENYYHINYPASIY